MQTLNARKGRDNSLWELNLDPKELPFLLASLTEGKGITRKLPVTLLHWSLISTRKVINRWFVTFLAVEVIDRFFIEKKSYLSARVINTVFWAKGLSVCNSDLPEAELVVCGSGRCWFTINGSFQGKRPRSSAWLMVHFSPLLPASLSKRYPKEISFDTASSAQYWLSSSSFAPR